MSKLANALIWGIIGGVITFLITKDYNTSFIAGGATAGLTLLLNL